MSEVDEKVYFKMLDVFCNFEIHYKNIVIKKRLDQDCDHCYELAEDLVKLEEKLRIATQALEYIHLRSGDSGGIAYQSLEELEKIK